MSHAAAPTLQVTKQQVLDRIEKLIPNFRARAAAAEAARRLPDESVREFLDAGLTRILMPPRFGGYGLGLDTWLEAVLAISKADASHGWCASLMIHHPHYAGQFPEEAQQAMWADGPDVIIAVSVMPTTRVTPVEGGYRISGQSAFASGVAHSSWVFIGGMVATEREPEWTFFLIPPKQYQVPDTWHTVGMRATGSNTIVTDNVFVPHSRTMRLSDIREGRGPGASSHEASIYRAPFIAYAPLTFAAPMLGAAQGAYDYFRDWTRERKGAGGISVAGMTSVQVRLARTAADLDAAELLLRRAADVAQAATPASPALRARSMRDYSRASELAVSAIDTLLEMSGTAGFAETNPIQRAWRDIHFSSRHISLNPENNFCPFRPDGVRPAARSARAVFLTVGRGNAIASREPVKSSRRS